MTFVSNELFIHTSRVTSESFVAPLALVRNWTHGKFGKNVGTRGSIFFSFSFFDGKSLKWIIFVRFS